MKSKKIKIRKNFNGVKPFTVVFKDKKLYNRKPKHKKPL